jgi:hypothetical protein
MFTPRLSSAARFAFAAMAGLLILSSASYAESQGQLRAGQAYGSDARASYIPHSPYVGSTPRDYSSSHVCINGYRWITRTPAGRSSLWDSPSDFAVPVRCN